MDKYFIDGYQIKRYADDSGGWSDGEGNWAIIKTIQGYMRTLGATERTEIGELNSTHRFYTKDKGMLYGDRIEKDNKKYNIKLVDEKNIPTSDLDFVQIDCELVT